MNEDEGNGTGMILRRYKGKIAAGSAVFLIVAVVLWSTYSSPSPLRLTYLYATNHPQSGVILVFELINELDEPVTSGGGHFHDANRAGLNPQKGDWGASIVEMKHFAARTTNIIQICCPHTNGQPWKLVLYCIPASKNAPQYHRSLRVRLVSFISPWVQPSFATQARWYGSFFIESQAFEITP
jgi:hypothetical protein